MKSHQNVGSSLDCALGCYFSKIYLSHNPNCAAWNISVSHTVLVIYITILVRNTYILVIIVWRRDTIHTLCIFIYLLFILLFHCNLFIYWPGKSSFLVSNWRLFPLILFFFCMDVKIQHRLCCCKASARFQSVKIKPWGYTRFLQVRDQTSWKCSRFIRIIIPITYITDSIAIDNAENV